jgi:hypothetical protein
MSEMNVTIDEAVATVRTVDGQSLLDERTLAQIIRAVLAALEDKQARDRRRDEETRIDDDGRRGLAGLRG